MGMGDGMNNWIWPFSLYSRIRILEEQLAISKDVNQQLQDMLRGQAVQSTLAGSSYVAAMAAISRHIGPAK